MKIAVVGAGFLGLASAHALSENHSVTLFDKQGIGSGASGIAAGLLHPYAGKKATLNWMGRAAYSDAVELLELASMTAGKPVMKKNGIFRPACTKDLYDRFLLASQIYPECLWQEHFGQAGIFIPCGIQVDCPLYLKALFARCQDKGVSFQNATISSTKELEDFDAAVFCVGIDFSSIANLAHPPINVVKGQLLELEYDQTLSFAISAQSYVAQVHDGYIVAGSTYEHSWKTPEADLASCEVEIRAKLAQFSKPLSSLPVRQCKAGFRATTADKRPFIQKCGLKCWCLGGLGSKGLLYHAWLAKQLSEAIKPLSKLH